MMSKSEGVRAEVAATERELEEVRRKAEGAEGEALGGLGALIAGLSAKAEALRAKLAKTLASETAEAQAEQERQQAETRKQVKARLKARKESLEKEWAELVGDFEATFAKLPDMWKRYHRLIDTEIPAWEREGQEMGLGAIERGQSDVFQRMQRPHSLLTFEPWR